MKRSFCAIRAGAREQWAEDVAAIRRRGGDLAQVVIVALDSSVTRDPLGVAFACSAPEAFDRVVAIDRELAALAFRQPPAPPFALIARRTWAGLLDVELSPVDASDPLR